MRKAVAIGIRVSSDILAFTALFIAMCVLKSIEPYNLGYFLSDTTLQKTFHQSTIRSVVLYAVSSVLIFLTVVTMELVIAYNVLDEKKSGVPVVLMRIYNYLLIAFFGYFVTITITDVGKAAAGRLRPNFYSLCNPIVTSTANFDFVTSYACRNGTAKDHKEVRKSFPSGHTSTAIYSAVFLCLYLQLRQSNKWRLPALRVALQLVFLALAAVTSISRVQDNKHHPTDVIAGAVLGLLVALATVHFSCDSFKSDQENAVRRIEPCIESSYEDESVDPTLMNLKSPHRIAF